MFIKLGKYQAWLERTETCWWKPEIERGRGIIEVWFLRAHLVMDW